MRCVGGTRVCMISPCSHWLEVPALLDESGEVWALRTILRDLDLRFSSKVIQWNYLDEFR